MTKNILCLLFLFGAALVCVSQSVTGVVADSEGEPLIGATVREVGTANGGVTDLDGRFNITVSKLPTTLEASYTGYAAQRIEVANAEMQPKFTLTNDVTVLDDIIVTGLASAVKRENAANAVSVVRSEALTGTTVQSTMDGALYGKFTGVELKSNSGAPGGGMAVKLRGVSSIFSDQQPLYIIDGVYVDNSTISLGNNIASAAASGGNAATNQDDATNRIADIDPEDIESIEILKGASAAAIYGSRAAGGVVIINTKRGESGKSKVTFAQDFGVLRPIRLLGTRKYTEDMIEPNFFKPDPDATPEEEAKRKAALAAAQAAFRQNGQTDYEAVLFDRSPIQSTSRLEFSGGNDKTQFFLGGTLLNQNGLVENTGYDKKSVRFNLNHQLTDRIQLDASTNYVNSSSDRGYFNNSNNNSTIGYARAFTKPWESLFADENGVYPAGSAGSNILETINNVTNNEQTNRFIGGLTARVELLKKENSKLDLQLRGGVDQYTTKTRSIFPRQLSYFRPNSSLKGVSVAGTAVNKTSNASAFLVYTTSPSKTLELRSQAGVTNEKYRLEIIRGIGTNLNGSQSNINQSANQSLNQSIIPQEDKGFFVQQEANFDDKIIVTAGLRGDKSSNNGNQDEFTFSPKANLAFRLVELGLIESDQIDQLKVRLAYGQSARPTNNFNARFDLYGPTFIGGLSGFQSSTIKGNPNVRPEKQSELEFGTDVSLFDGDVNFTATYYIKTINDLLLDAAFSPSSGYTREVVNGGSLRNNGLELELSAAPLSTSSPVEWQTGLNWWKNKSKVTKLGVPAFTTGGFAASLGQYLIKEGESATTLVGKGVDGDCSDCREVDLNGTKLKVFGNAEPKFNMSWSNNFKYKDFDFSFLWHWKNGGDQINLSTLLYDLGNITWDYDEKTLDPSGKLNNGDYRKSIAFKSAAPWIEDASYLRLREVGLHYSLPKSFLANKAKLKVGLSGRNLINSFKYNSYDPESSNFGGNVLANAVEVTPYPSSKSVNFQIKAIF